MVDFIGTFTAGCKAFFSWQGFAILLFYAALLAGAQRRLVGPGEDRPWISVVWRLGLTYWVGFGLAFLILMLPNTGIGLVFWAHQHLLGLVGGLTAVYVGLSMSGLAWWERGDDGRREDWTGKVNPYLAVCLIGMGQAATWLPPASAYLGAAVIYSGVPGALGSSLVFFALYLGGMILPSFIMGQFLAGQLAGDQLDSAMGLKLDGLLGVIVLIYGVFQVFGGWNLASGALAWAGYFFKG